MIYTLTLDPELDYSIRVPGFEKAKQNIVEMSELVAGGKGLKVSTMLKKAGVESVALGFTAGVTGIALENYIKSIEIDYDFVRVYEGETRVNITIRAEDETFINSQGPVVNESELYMLNKRLDSIKTGDYLYLGGNVPRGVDNGFYYDVMERLSGKGIRAVLDFGGDSLVKALALKPFLIRLDIKEISEIFRNTVKTREDAIVYGTKLHKMGAENVIVTLGYEGAVFIGNDNRIHALDIPKEKSVNEAKYGEAIIAGFLAGLRKFHEAEPAFRYTVINSFDK